jgi:hypothetical protein
MALSYQKDLKVYAMFYYTLCNKVGGYTGIGLSGSSVDAIVSRL